MACAYYFYLDSEGQVTAESKKHSSPDLAISGGGPKPVSNFDDHAGPLTEMVLVGNLAARLGKSIKFPAKFDACDLRDVRKFIKRSYRAGWEPQLA